MQTVFLNHAQVVEVKEPYKSQICSQTNEKRWHQKLLKGHVRKIVKLMLQKH